MGKGMSRYKFFWQGCKDGNAVKTVMKDGKRRKRLGYLFQTGGLIGLLMWREWMNALYAWSCWSVTSWWPASVHIRLKQVEVLRRKILSGIKWSVWQEAWSISELFVVGGDLNGHVGTNVDGYDGIMADMALEREMPMVSMGSDWYEHLFQETEEQIGHLCIWWYSGCNWLLAVARMWPTTYKKRSKSLLEKSVSQHHLLVGDVVISSATTKN